MVVAGVGTAGGKNVARWLLSNECLRSLLSLLFALHMRRDNLVFDGAIKGQSLETACVEHVVCTCSE